MRPSTGFLIVVAMELGFFGGLLVTYLVMR